MEPKPEMKDICRFYKNGCCKSNKECRSNFGESGLDSRFVVEANTKALQPKPSQSRVIKLMDRGQVELSCVESNIKTNIEAESAIFRVIGEL